MSYIRFVIPQNDEDSCRRQGIFQAMYDLERDNSLFPHEQEIWEQLRHWFRKNLEAPNSFSRSSKPDAKHVAISWFKDSAIEHIR